MQARAIHEIAAEIRADWGNEIANSADPYVSAMERLTEIGDTYHHDSAVEVVTRFLSVATPWHGPTARRIKTELNALLDHHAVGLQAKSEPN